MCTDLNGTKVLKLLQKFRLGIVKEESNFEIWKVAFACLLSFQWSKQIYQSFGL